MKSAENVDRGRTPGTGISRKVTATISQGGAACWGHLSSRTGPYSSQDLGTSFLGTRLSGPVTNLPLNRNLMFADFGGNSGELNEHSNLGYISSTGVTIQWLKFHPRFGILVFTLVNSMVKISPNWVEVK